MTVRIGVTGSGFMGRTHVEAARRIETAEIIAVAGGSRAPKLAADYHIDCEPDAATLAARSDIDAIVISTPHYLHCEEALLAAANGKHVLIEKPLATTLDDCDRLTRACADANVVLSVGYHQRFRQANIEARRLLQSGAIGPVRCIQTSALFDIQTMREGGGFGGGWSWWTDPKSVAHLINSAPHTIDLLRWWLGQELTTAAASCKTFREENPNENTTMALLTISGGAMCTFWSSSVAPAPGFPGESFRFRIMADDGLLDVDPYDKLQITRGGEWKTIYQQAEVKFDQADAAMGDTRMGAYCDQMRAFVGRIQNNQSDEDAAEGVGKDGRAGVAGVLAMLESSDSGRIVSIANNARRAT